MFVDPHQPTDHHTDPDPTPTAEGVGDGSEGETLGQDTQVMKTASTSQPSPAEPAPAQEPKEDKAHSTAQKHQAPQRSDDGSEQLGQDGPQSSSAQSFKVVATAKHKGAQISARKARLVADLIRGATIKDAYVQLQFSQKKAAKMIQKLLHSAVNNARQSGRYADDLVVGIIYVNEGRTMMRSRPRARGRVSPIRKRSCHIIIEIATASKAYHNQRKHQRSMRHLKQAQLSRSLRRQASRKRPSKTTTPTPAS